jgi:RNA polymerase sigma factor (sigma-70 family)
MTAETDRSDATRPDAALVAAVLDGDRSAFAEVYDRYADRLYDFAHSMLRNPEDASDAVADAFVTFAEKLPQLREPDRLRPWLYAIVRSECLRRIKGRGRIAFGGDEPLVDMADTAMASDEVAATSELRQLVWDAAGGLAERDRAILDLHLRQGLDGADLGEAMGVSASSAYVLMNRLRGQLERSLGALLVAKTGRDDCSDLDNTLADWDGDYSPLVRKRVARHVDNCPRCTMRKAAMASPLALFAGVSAFAAPAGLRERVLSGIMLEAGRVSEPATTGGSGWHRWAKLGGIAAAIIALVVLLVPGRLSDTTATVPVDAVLKPQPSQPAAPVATPSAGPAVLVISDQHLVLRRNNPSADTTLSNTGGEPLDYSLRPASDGVFSGGGTGHLDPGASTTLSLELDKDQWPARDIKTGMVVQWDHGSIDIEIEIKVDGDGDDDRERDEDEPTGSDSTPTEAEQPPVYRIPDYAPATTTPPRIRLPERREPTARPSWDPSAVR